MISADGLLQKHQYEHGLKHDIIAPHSVVCVILPEFTIQRVIKEPFGYLKQ